MTSTSMPYIIGNWKMNLDVESAISLAAASAEMADEAANDVGIGVAVPHLWIPLIAGQFAESDLLMGAQNVSQHRAGAFTGEISAEMLAPWCTFVLVGHSERRQHHGETNDIVRSKLDAILANGMAPVLCVGETAEERAAGNAKDIVETQLSAAVGHLTSQQFRGLLIAYEPVWAIGTGNTATPTDAQAMAAHIRSLLTTYAPESAQEVPILYGGSVNPQNAGSFFREPDIDGALVGGASLKANDFLEVIRAAIEN